MAGTTTKSPRALRPGGDGADARRFEASGREDGIFALYRRLAAEPKPGSKAERLRRNPGAPLTRRPRDPGMPASTAGRPSGKGARACPGEGQQQETEIARFLPPRR